MANNPSTTLAGYLVPGRSPTIRASQAIIALMVLEPEHVDVVPLGNPVCDLCGAPPDDLRPWADGAHDDCREAQSL